MIILGYAFTDEFIANLDREMQALHTFYRQDLYGTADRAWRDNAYKGERRYRILSALVSRLLSENRKSGLIRYMPGVSAWRWIGETK